MLGTASGIATEHAHQLIIFPRPGTDELNPPLKYTRILHSREKTCARSLIFFSAFVEFRWMQRMVATDEIYIISFYGGTQYGNALLLPYLHSSPAIPMHPQHATRRVFLAKCTWTKFQGSPTSNNSMWRTRGEKRKAKTKPSYQTTRGRGG